MSQSDEINKGMEQLALAEAERHAKMHKLMEVLNAARAICQFYCNMGQTLLTDGQTGIANTSVELSTIHLEKAQNMLDILDSCADEETDEERRARVIEESLIPGLKKLREQLEESPHGLLSDDEEAFFELAMLNKQGEIKEDYCLNLSIFGLTYAKKMRMPCYPLESMVETCFNRLDRLSSSNKSGSGIDLGALGSLLGGNSDALKRLMDGDEDALGEIMEGGGLMGNLQQLIGDMLDKVLEGDSFEQIDEKLEQLGVDTELEEIIMVKRKVIKLRESGSKNMITLIKDKEIRAALPTLMEQFKGVMFSNLGNIANLFNNSQTVDPNDLMEQLRRQRESDE